MNLVVGKYYVDRTRQIARKIVCVEIRTISFLSFHLDTGNSDGNLSECLREHFMLWADHEALSSELNDLHSRMMEQSH